MGKNQSASGLTNVIQYDNNGNISFVSGSTTLMQVSSSGAITTTGVISGSSAQSASLAQNSNLLQGTGSVGFATTGSFTTMSSSLSSRTTQIESVYATTGSNSFRATQSITGSLTVTGQIIAQSLNVQQVTSSIVYSSGSNIFGCDINSRQTFTGSFYQTGSIAIFNSCVGIGLNNPTNRLEVQSGDIKLNAGASRCTNIFFGLTGTNYGKIQYSDTDGSMLITTIGSGAGYDLNLGTQCTTRLTILGDGKVGIGTTSPCTLLHTVIPTCYGTNGTVANSHPIVTFSQCDCGAGARGLQIGAPTGGVNSPVFLKVSNTGVRFSIIDQSNCENFTISGGKVGIGITTPEYPLHIYNCNRTGMKIQTCDSTFGSPSINLLNVAVDTVLSATNTGLELGTWTANDILFRTTQIERMRITSAGIACFACQVCAPSGVKFGSGTTTLNYYEEGNWTPIYQDSTSTPSYITQFGRYTKIGRLVHVVGKISASNLGGGNAIIIGGLPFSASDASDSGQRVSIRPEGDWSGLGSLFTTTLFRANGANFQGVRDNGSGQSIFARYNDYSGTLYFNFNATYYV